MSYSIYECSPKAKVKIKDDAYDDPKPVATEKHYRTKYPFGSLTVGQCFTIPIAEVNEVSLRNACSIYAKRAEKTFTIIRHNEHGVIECARIA